MFTEERAQWLYQHYLWLEQSLPPRMADYRAPLILPTPEFYPMRHTRDHAFAEAVFDTTRSYMGVLDWKCILSPQADAESQERAAMRDSGLLGELHHSSAAGTFSSGENVEITYSPQLLGNPSALVATLAHELCHYLIQSVSVAPPAGWDEHEPLTDLAAVHEGFGVFLCNTAFQFSQWSDERYAGWRSSTTGYLNEAELGFALGIFCVRNHIDPNLALPHLKQNPAEVFWDSLDYIEGLEK